MELNLPKNLRGTGDFSRISIQAIQQAETMQGLALVAIRDQFGTTKLGLDLTKDFSYEEFMTALSQAEADGTREEFEADLGRQFATLFQQQAAAAQQQQAGGQ